ncbi:MAG: sulfite exporter TauE/SafE family protein [Saprospiraceae bacterium]|nr:sulfite exporter TauE/SafE family protein [Saprospiraceae bacterium]
MLWSAFIMGLLGSLHCAGMCGPIALAIPGTEQTPLAMGMRSLSYNLGRTLTYSAMGLVFGLLGASVRLAGFQSSLSLIMGVMMIAIAFFTLDFEKKLLQIPLLTRFYGMVQIRLGRLLKMKGVQGALGIGILNGFLPCGLVYAAVFGAISTGNALQGAAYMALFGLGTIPLMFSIAFAGQWMHASLRAKLRQMVPYFLTIVGILLIMRGLNFDLPYDFRFWQEAAETPMCH